MTSGRVQIQIFETPEEIFKTLAKVHRVQVADGTGTRWISIVVDEVETTFFGSDRAPVDSVDAS